MHRSSVSRLAMYSTVAVLATTPALSAQTWTTWTSDPSASFNGPPGYFYGTLLGSAVTFFGNYVGGQLSNGSGTDYYAPDGAYTQNGLTSPDAGNNFGFIQFNWPVTGTIDFATPVTGLYMAFISVGSPNVAVTYHFSDSFTVLSNDNSDCPYFGCGTYSASSNTLTGNEFSGTIKFDGTVSELTFTTDRSEYWHGVTVGADALASTATPEPSTMMLMATGFAGVFVGARQRRRRRHASERLQERD